MGWWSWAEPVATFPSIYEGGDLFLTKGRLRWGGFGQLRSF